MKRKNIKYCPSFKSICSENAMHNKPLTTNCSHCVYFSSKNCHFNSSNDIEGELDFI